jgi:hypothetical protein
MVPFRTSQVVINTQYKVIWVYNGHHQIIPEMYDRPRRLCEWWMKEHARDAQYAVGRFILVSMMSDKTS